MGLSFFMFNVPMYLKQFSPWFCNCLCPVKTGLGNSYLFKELLSVGIQSQRIRSQDLAGYFATVKMTIMLRSRGYLFVLCFPSWPSLGLIWRIPKPYTFHWGSIAGNPNSGTNFFTTLTYVSSMYQKPIE